jgi:hypothetical protein
MNGEMVGNMVKNSFGWELNTDSTLIYNLSKKRWGERTWEISVYNLYNRMNPFFYTIMRSLMIRSMDFKTGEPFSDNTFLTYSFRF